MKLQQLRFLREIVKQGLNVSAAAESLYTSQPGISKQIKLLEDELGVDVFIRAGKRIVDVTPPGREIVKTVERILSEVENLKRITDEYHDQQKGQLTVATTHTQARYALPLIIKQFTEKYPNVKVNLLQGSPSQIAQLVVDGVADFAIATEALHLFEDLILLPCYEWNRSIILPLNHPLLNENKPLTLQNIADYPIITYDFAFAGRSKVNQAFSQAKITPNVVLTAIDADVIKKYVELGMGIGIIATMAYEPEKDHQLGLIDASHLFESSITSIAMRKNSYLRGYMYDFIEMFSPQNTRQKVVEQFEKFHITHT